MSERIGDVFHIHETPPAECEMCGRLEELRPYGPNGESICFNCALIDIDAAKRQFAKMLDGAAVVTAPEDALARARKQ